jgi:hypothetical protein
MYVQALHQAERQLRALTRGPCRRDSEEAFYPGYLVAATSAMGFALAARLDAWRVISPPAAWAMHCIYAAKLMMLLLPTARPVQPLLLLLFAATPPLFPRVLCPNPPPGRQRRSTSDAGEVTEAKPMTVPRTTGALLCCAIVLAVAGARLVIFDAVTAALGTPPAAAVLLAALLAVVAAATAPLVYCCFPHSLARPLASIGA